MLLTEPHVGVEPPEPDGPDHGPAARGQGPAVRAADHQRAA